MPITTDTAGMRRSALVRGERPAARRPLRGPTSVGAALATQRTAGCRHHGQQVRQVVEDRGKVQHVLVRNVPGLQARVLWVGREGAGQARSLPTPA